MINKGYRQGIFRPRNASKCKSQSCVYRSSLELHYMRWLDTNPNIVSWGSEGVVIPYIKPTDGKLHRYFIDFNFTIIDKQGNPHKFLVEIKPERQCRPPIKGRQKPITLLREQLAYATNQAKWEAATQWATKNGYKFQVVTENQVKSLNIAK